MSTISIRRAHRLEHEQAAEVADSVAAELHAEFGIQSSWREDVLHFEGRHVTGTMKLAPRELVLDLRLGFLLFAFRERIVREIESRLDAVLAEPARGGARNAASARTRPAAPGESAKRATAAGPAAKGPVTRGTGKSISAPGKKKP